MNLHQIVSGVVAAVNPFQPVLVQISAGSTANLDGTQTPAYEPPVQISVQMQPAPWSSIKHIDSLNQQGTHRFIYTNGLVRGAVRVVLKGGDLVTTMDGLIWLVVQPIEVWYPTAGWTKFLMTLQNQTAS